MSFVSATFFIFLGIVILAYYLVPKRVQWVLLLIASYLFYLYSGPKVMLFLVFTTLVVYGGGRWMQHVKDTTKSQKAAKKKNVKILILELIINFGILLVLKYYNFAAENIMSAFSLFHYDLKMPLVNIILPMGISFYTFQAMGYTIDVYKNKYAAEKNLLHFALFISFFPQMTQGPISRYDALAPQLTAEHPLKLNNLKYGAELMLWGYFKKLVIADRAGTVVSAVFGNYSGYDGFQVFFAMVLYAIQIYADFSGGIDMTRGMAQMMGIDLVDNFRQPYFGDNVSEYWRRWHMSLTNWMRDYVFFPLTLAKFSRKIGKWGKKHLGSVGKQLPAYLPTFVTFTLIGIWHGAGWGFIIYGFLNAGVIILSMLFKGPFTAWKKALHINDKSFGWRVFGIVRTFLIMVYLKTISRATDVHTAFAMMKKSLTLFMPSSASFVTRITGMGLTGSELIALAVATAILFTISVLRERGVHIREALSAKPLALRWVLILALLAVVLIFGVYGEGYSASDFVYRNY